MTDDLDPRIEEQISAWRAFVSRPQAIDGRDVDELEDHLRGQIGRLEASGLDGDEAFLVAVKRLGGLDDLSREFAREHSDRLWKQLMVPGEPRTARAGGLALAVGLAIGAGLAMKVPALFGVEFAGGGQVYPRFLPLLVLPFLAAYFLVRRRSSARTIAMVVVPFALAALVMSVYPFAPDAATLLLAFTHLIVVLWLVVGIAYVDGRITGTRPRMDFIRFTGEWIVYLALIALGGGLLIALTMGVFAAIDVDASWFVQEWMLPCGIAGAVVIAGWLVEAKQSVIENIAPVLTKLFTPLFTLLLLAFIVAGFVQGSLVDGAEGPEAFGQRDLLILFDIVLVVVVGLLLYALSAREPLAPPSWFDRLQLLMVVAALVVDIMVLVAMIGRIAEWGASPNKLASLGLNVILFANLVGAAWLQLRFAMRRAPFERLERWQTGFLPVYLAWAAIVVVVFPPLFAFA